MTSQDTYGGVTYSNFGTRNLAFLKVVLSGGTPPDFTAGTGPTGVYTLNNNYQDSNDYFSVAVRTIQQFGEIYFVGAPTAQAFVVAVAIDTAADATSGNVENLSYPTLSSFGLLAAQLLNALGAWGSGAVTITQLTASGSSIA
jgi:hypothetical protein